ncbi:Transmembrane protein 72 [Triplophysa tibetana]|uniref:Transmembrane protein 72 n=1 Tax=Triplophysa tibetana TaxID=1572043 RepID=A0A5A9PA58_9TELE|nr:Transmembrane protein 72 [Triplophysa tibetana]
MTGSALWVIVECACRGFGISTATVLCAVGIETLRQGEFQSLAVYLLCSPTKRFFIVWKKLAKVGGFQKFLYYTMMSIMCFLHPVLAWHAVIPGMMLLVTGFLNFILSKKKKSEPPKESSAFNDPTQSSVSFTDMGDTEQTFSFFHIISGKRASVFLNNSRSHGLTDSTRSMLEEDQSLKKAHHKKTNTNMRNLHFIESIKEEDSEMEELEETSSEKAPIIRL